MPPKIIEIGNGNNVKFADLINALNNDNKKVKGLMRLEITGIERGKTPNYRGIGFNYIFNCSDGTDEKAVAFFDISGNLNLKNGDSINTKVKCEYFLNPKTQKKEIHFSTTSDEIIIAKKMQLYREQFENSLLAYQKYAEEMGLTDIVGEINNLEALLETEDEKKYEILKKSKITLDNALDYYEDRIYEALENCKREKCDELNSDLTTIMNLRKALRKEDFIKEIYKRLNLSNKEILMTQLQMTDKDLSQFISDIQMSDEELREFLKEEGFSEEEIEDFLKKGEYGEYLDKESTKKPSPVPALIGKKVQHIIHVEYSPKHEPSNVKKQIKDKEFKSVTFYDFIRYFMKYNAQLNKIEFNYLISIIEITNKNNKTQKLENIDGKSLDIGIENQEGNIIFIFSSAKDLVYHEIIELKLNEIKNVYIALFDQDDNLIVINDQINSNEAESISKYASNIMKSIDYGTRVPIKAQIQCINRSKKSKKTKKTTKRKSSPKPQLIQKENGSDLMQIELDIISELEEFLGKKLSDKNKNYLESKILTILESGYSNETKLRDILTELDQISLSEKPNLKTKPSSLKKFSQSIKNIVYQIEEPLKNHVQLTAGRKVVGKEKYKCFYCDKDVTLKELQEVDDKLDEIDDDESREFLLDNLPKISKKREKPYIHEIIYIKQVGLNLCKSCFYDAKAKSEQLE